MINKNFLFIFLFFIAQGAFAMTTVQLPKPQINKNMYLDQAIAQRRSVRSFTDKQLSQSQISQLLWAAQGITDPAKVWQYLVQKHALRLIVKGDMREKLAEAALGQSPVKNAPVSIVITANYRKITAKYHERGIIYAHLEAGHAAQNLVLESVSLGLGSVTIGAFHNHAVGNLLHSEDPLYIIPVGYKL